MTEILYASVGVIIGQLLGYLGVVLEHKHKRVAIALWTMTGLLCLQYIMVVWWVVNAPRP